MSALPSSSATAGSALHGEHHGRPRRTPTQEPCIGSVCDLHSFVSFLVIPGAAQEDLSKCRSIAIPALRLECYDNLSKPTYTRMSISDLSRDRSSLAKVQAKVEVASRLQELIGGESYELGSKLSMADRITINTKDLPRDQQKAILDRCNSGCDAVVQGRVMGNMGNTWLSAEFFRFLRTPVERAD
jgi:hypothetical protein